MIVSTLKVQFLFSFLFRWNQLDVAIVFLSVLGIVLEELKSDLMPINPTIMRVMRVLRIARGKETKTRQTTLDASLLLRSINVRNWMNISSSILFPSSAQAPQNGQRYSSSLRHRNAGLTSGRKLGAFVLPPLLHFRRFGSGNVWKTW